MSRFGPLLAQEETVIRGLRVAIAVLLVTSAFAGSVDARTAMARFSARSLTVAGKPATAIPNGRAGASGQRGIANKGGAISPGERQQGGECAVQPGAAAGKNGTDCPPAKAAKEGDTPGAGNVEPAPHRRAGPCIGFPDRQCL